MSKELDGFMFAFTEWEKSLLEDAFKLLIKQERRAGTNIANIAQSMLDAIENAKPNTVIVEEEEPAVS
jgi:hypothetical protein